MKKLRATMAFVLASVLIMTNMVFASDRSEETQVQECIRMIEAELNENNTNVTSELTKMISYYKGLLEQEGLDSAERDKINALISTLEKQLQEYDNYKSGVVTRGLPNPVYSPAVSAVITWFGSKGYLLAAELLTHAVDNDLEDSTYYPNNGDRVTLSPVFKKIKSMYNTGGQAECPDSNVPVEKDLYYAIHGFTWVKRNGVVTIKDRYDFKPGDYEGIAGAAVNTMVLAQQNGVIVPFQVRIVK